MERALAVQRQAHPVTHRVPRAPGGVDVAGRPGRAVGGRGHGGVGGGALHQAQLGVSLAAEVADVGLGAVHGDADAVVGPDGLVHLHWRAPGAAGVLHIVDFVGRPVVARGFGAGEGGLADDLDLITRPKVGHADLGAIGRGGDLEAGLVGVQRVEHEGELLVRRRAAIASRVSDVAAVIGGLRPVVAAGYQQQSGDEQKPLGHPSREHVSPPVGLWSLVSGQRQRPTLPSGQTQPETRQRFRPLSRQASPGRQ